jgi:hypothetical protein
MHYKVVVRLRDGVRSERSTLTMCLEDCSLWLLASVSQVLAYHPCG